MNRRGDMPSVIISLIVIMFVLGITAIIFSKVFLAVTAELKTQPEFSSNTISTIETVEGKTNPLLDYVFFFSFIAIIIGLIISSIYIDTTPALMIIFIIVLVVAVVLAGIFANVFAEIVGSSELSSTYSNFPLTNIIITHFPLLIFAVGLLVAIILYGKAKGGSSPV